MAKKKSKAPEKTRAEPISYGTAWMCSPDAYRILAGGGSFTRLTDCPEVRMCVDVYAELISSMTIHLMENTELGDRRVKNELSRKLDISPSRWMTRKTLISHIVRVLLLEGNGNQVTYPRFTPDGLLDELIPLKPSAALIKDLPNGSGYFIKYGEQTFQPDEVLHFVINPDPETPWRGTGYNVVLRDIVRGLKLAGRTKQALLENPSPSLIVKVDGLADEFTTLEGRKKLKKQYLDDSENGTPWMVPAEVFEITTVKPLTMNDLAIAKNLELDKRSVAGVYGVPGFLVGVGEYKKDEYNNFIRTKVMPLAMAIQQVFTKGLLYSPDWYWRFNPRSLYAYDLSELQNIGSAMVDRMAMSRNEWRDWVGMSPREDMEELLALENYIPADRLGDQGKLLKTGGGDDADI